MEYQLSEHLQEGFSALQLNDDLLFLRISPKIIYNQNTYSNFYMGEF